MLLTKLDKPKLCSLVTLKILHTKWPKLFLLTALMVVIEPRIMFSEAFAAAVNKPAEVAFIDTGLADWETLRDGTKDGIDVILIDGNKDGLEQIVKALDGRTNIDSIHILSHGSDGEIKLGSFVLGTNNVDLHSAELAKIGQSLAPDGDILLYGCKVAAGDKGAIFIQNFADLTGANISASTDATGNVGQGGNWVLETSAGNIRSNISLNLPTQLAYNHWLATPIIGTTTFNSATTTGLGSGNGTTVVSSPNVFGTGWDLSATFTGNTSTANLLRGHASAGTGGSGSGAVQTGASPADFVQSSTFASNDGSEFDLKSIDINSSQGATSITITGYRDGVSVPGATLNDSLPLGNFAGRTFTTVNIDGDDDFNNIDSFTITYTTPQYRFVFDNLVIGVAMTATPTLVSATFADNNLIIGETSTVTFVFSTAVTGFTTTDLTIPNGGITGLGTSDGGTTWTGYLYA